jgi:hypothetical protein
MPAPEHVTHVSDMPMLAEHNGNTSKAPYHWCGLAGAASPHSRKHERALWPCKQKLLGTRTQQRHAFNTWFAAKMRTQVSIKQNHSDQQPCP